MSTFGASAPYKTCFQEFGMTVDNVVTSAKELLNKIKEQEG
jgi:transketolase